MPTIAEVLNQGLAHHNRGELDEAERLYRQALEANAQSAEAWHLLGLVAHARGDAATAVDSISRAIRLDGAVARYHNHLAEVYRSLSRLADAEQSCRRALDLNEDFALAHNTLGLVRQQRGRYEEAVASFRRALELEPGFALALSNLAGVLHTLGRLDEALDACREALARDPALAPAIQVWGAILRDQGKVDEAFELFRQALRVNPRLAAVHSSLGTLLQLESRLDEAIACYRAALAIDPNNDEAHCNLGSALKDLGRTAEAVQCYRRALQCNPSLAEAHFNLGALLQSQGHSAEAMQCYQRAIQARPDYALAYNNLGTLYKMNDLARATECYSKALELQPNSAEALNNLGNVLKMQGRLAEAAVCYEQTLRFRPDYAQAHYNRGLLLLAHGDFAAGWPEYEYRSQCPGFPQRSFDEPRWQGEALGRRRVLVYAEQGLGDTMQFVRYLPLLADRAAAITLEVQPPLVALLKQSGFDRMANLVAGGEPLGKIDVQLPLLSLPGIFRTTLENIPAAGGGYLAADPHLVEHWRGVLGDAPTMKVGIAWQGSATYVGDRFRSIPPAQFEPLALDGVELISLQKGAGAEQLADVAGKFRVRDLGADFDEARGPFMDTAAVMKNLDLVITSDTAVAHLAGALGVEVWVALARVPDWRWMFDRPDSPWYASMRLFRQERPADWPGVFAALVAELHTLLSRRGLN